MSYYDKLHDLGIKLTRTSGQEKTFCPKCHADRKNKRDRSLSVNITSGEFRCHNCDYKGNVKEFETKKEFKKLSRDQFIPKNSTPGEKMREHIKTRGISERTINKFMVYQKAEYMPQTKTQMNCICFPYFRGDELVNVKFRDGSKNFKMVSQAELIFYNLNSVQGKTKCIIVEGEFDAMIGFECGFGDDANDEKYNIAVAELMASKTKELQQENEDAKKSKRVAPNDLKNSPVTEHEIELTPELRELQFLSGWGMLSVPNGASDGSLKLEYLDNCAAELLCIDEFIIATDGDGPGMRLRDELVRRLGVEKCRIVKYPSHLTYMKDGQKKICKDLNEVKLHHGVQAVRDLIRNAETIRIDGIYYVEEMYATLMEKFRNGVKMGDTTRMQVMDDFFRWKKGEQILWTGYGNHGKTTFFLQMALIKSIYDGWKWGIFSPENFPPDDFYDDLVEMYVGKWIQHMSEEEYSSAIIFINDHFFYVYPEADHTLKTIHDKFRYLVLKKGIDGVLIDPWNQLDHVQKSYQREDQYLSEQLTVTKRFALHNAVHYNIIAHPKSPSYKDDKSLPVVDMYDVNGGAMWGNKMDGIISYYRPDWHIDKKSPNVEIHIQKVKRKRTGGDQGWFPLRLDWNIKRYKDNFDNVPCNPDLARRVIESERNGIIPAATAQQINFIPDRSEEEARNRLYIPPASSKSELRDTEGNLIDDLPF
jgi:hypothetical protein